MDGPPMSPDNWGRLARFGVFISASEAVPEAEWWAMAPPGVSVHAARIAARAPWATWREARSGLDLAEDLARGCQHFASMRLSVVVLGHSSSSMLGGQGWDEAVVERLSTEIGSATVLTTNGLDCLAAMRTCGMRRPFLVLPPWFDAALVATGVDYFAARGFAPAGHLHYDPGPRWRDLPPAALYPAGMGFEQEVAPLHAQIRAACPAAADGVLIAGTGFRCVAILESLERELGRPVLSANQASLWHGLRLSGLDARVEGYGSLFTL